MSRFSVEVISSIAKTYLGTYNIITLNLYLHNYGGFNPTNISILKYDLKLRYCIKWYYLNFFYQYRDKEEYENLK